MDKICFLREYIAFIKNSEKIKEKILKISLNIFLSECLIIDEKQHKILQVSYKNIK